MIVAQRKPLEAIERMLGGCRRVLLVGCGTCTAVCQAGGEREVALLAAQLRMRASLAGNELVADEITLTRQCDREYIEQLAGFAADYEALLSLACGAGVQLLADAYAQRPVLPALDTRFIGVTEAPGNWAQRCVACADCLLDRTGGICPHTRCPKGLLNGPCGGTDHGRCEVNPDEDCAWALIYRRLEALGRLELLRRIEPPKDHSLLTRPGRCVQHAADKAESDE